MGAGTDAVLELRAFVANVHELHRELVAGRGHAICHSDMQRYLSPGCVSSPVVVQGGVTSGVDLAGRGVDAESKHGRSKPINQAACRRSWRIVIDDDSLEDKHVCCIRFVKGYCARGVISKHRRAVVDVADEHCDCVRVANQVTDDSAVAVDTGVSGVVRHESKGETPRPLVEVAAGSALHPTPVGAGGGARVGGVGADEAIGLPIAQGWCDVGVDVSLHGK